jgi:molybdate transport system substrate-binding protein
VTVGYGFSAALIALAVSAAGCGSDDEPAGGAGELTVSAASSLTEAFGAYEQGTPAAERFSFAGSDELAAQIRQGAKPDLYAAANTELPEMLRKEGLVGQPTVFATNSLVLAVRKGSDIGAVDDLTDPGVDLVIGSEDVPFGAYTQTVLDRLPAAQRDAILANVRSEESDVKAAVGKLSQGAADASFTYASDVAAAGDRLEGVELPAELQPDVAYGVAVVESAEDPEAAQEFIDGLLSGEGAQALEDAGFGPPPEG